MLNLYLSLLGNFEATLDTVPLTQFRTRSVQALLIYLVCEAARPSARELLMDLLWPGMPLSSAQANMRQTLYRLRKLIPEVQGKNGAAVPFLINNRQTIQINPDAAYFADVHAFSHSINIQPEKAIELYRGDFLSDFYLPDSETFAAWMLARRAEFQRQVLGAMETATAVHIQSANFDQAVHLAQRQLAIDNLRESSHRQLMEAWARHGRRQEAITHYNHLRQLLQDELAIEPDAETHALIEAIRADSFDRPVASARQPITPDRELSPKHNLPQRLTSFIGRQKELAEVKNALSSARLVTLTGSGGVGKTRLSLEAARTLQEEYEHGVWLVELAPQTDPALVPQTVAFALGLVEDPDRSVLTQLVEFLKKRTLLLVLDNCEHLIEACAQLANTLLRACPNLHILASSREALGVPGETPYRVPSLPIPDPNILKNLDDLIAFETMQLFTERAGTVQPGFALTPENAPTVARICQRLDGIPLAIELAAARVKVMTTAQIAERLDDRFRLLTGGSRTALPRQQTLRAMIDWSYNLLTEAERTLLRRLSVFIGGWTLESAEAVCSGSEIETYEVLDLLTGLVEKSLVLTEKTGAGIRYHRLETIRQYALEKFLDTNEVGAVRDQHLAYFMELAEIAEGELQGPNVVDWLERIDRNIKNIFSALAWATETDVTSGLRLISALAFFLELKEYIQEPSAWFTRLSEKIDESIPASVCAKAYFAGYLILFSSGDYRKRLAYLEKSLALYQALQDQAGIADVKWFIAFAKFTEEGDFVQSEKIIRESLAYFEEVGDKNKQAYIYNTMAGNIYSTKDTPLALAYGEKSLALCREIGDFTGARGALNSLIRNSLHIEDLNAVREYVHQYNELEQKLSLPKSSFINHIEGRLCYFDGDYARARSYFSESLELDESSGRKGSKLWTLGYLGLVELREGNFIEAHRRVQEGIAVLPYLSMKIAQVFLLEVLADLAVQIGLPAPAACLLAWADARRLEIGDYRPQIEQKGAEKLLQTIRVNLDERALSIAKTAGEQMSYEEALAYALQEIQI